MRVAKTNLMKREKLVARPLPYFNSIAPKRLLGYIRASASAAGRWIVQLEIGRENGKPIRRRETLGVADDLAQANGSDVLSYAQAVSAAINWSPSEKLAVQHYTVRRACEDYVAAFSTERGQRWAASLWSLLRWNVLREESNGQPRAGRRGLGDRPVIDLSTEELKKDWRDALVEDARREGKDERRAKSTANRILSPFKAALNHAFRSEKVPSDVAWRKALTKFEKVDQARQEHFSEIDVLALIDKSRESDVAFADLCEGAFLTGARYGELCALSVGDFNAKRGILSIPERSDENRCKTGARNVILNDEAVEFFAKLADGRAADAPLFALDGERWGPWQQQRRIKVALAASGLSTDAVFYAFRHSHISRALENGAEISLVAKNCGTSVGQIEKHYAKLLANRAREMIRNAMPKLRGGSNVAPISRAA